MAVLLLNQTQLASKATPLPLAKYFLYAIAVMFVIAMHLYSLTDLQSDKQVLSNAAVWIVLSIAGMVGAYHVTNQRFIRFSRLSIGLFIGCLLLTLPLFYHSANLDLAWSRVIALWAGWCLYALLQQFAFTHHQKYKLLFYILLATWIESLLAYAQILLPNLGLGAAGQVFGVFKSADLLVSFLNMGLAISGVLIARQTESLVARNKFRHKLLILSPVLLVPVIIIYSGVVQWSVLIAIPLLIGPYLYQFATRSNLKLWFTSLLAGAVIGCVSLYGLHQADSKLVQTLPTQEEAWQQQIQAKSDLWRQSMDMLIEKPITGYGYGKFESAYLLYTAQQHQLNPKYPAGQVALESPDNDIMLFFIEGGLASILGVSLIVGLCCMKLLRSVRFSRLAVLAIFLPLLIQSQFHPSFSVSAIHWFSFIILIFWLDRVSRHYYRYEISKVSAIGVRLIACIVPGIIIFVMVTSVRTNHILTELERKQVVSQVKIETLRYPFYWYQRYQWDKHKNMLAVGMGSNEQAYIDSFIDHAIKLVQSHPRPLVYQKLIEAYQFKEESLKAKQVLAEAKFLFPQDTRFADMMIETKLSQQSSDLIKTNLQEAYSQYHQ